MNCLIFMDCVYQLFFPNIIKLDICVYLTQGKTVFLYKTSRNMVYKIIMITIIVKKNRMPKRHRPRQSMSGFTKSTRTTIVDIRQAEEK